MIETSAERETRRLRGVWSAVSADRVVLWSGVAAVVWVLGYAVATGLTAGSMSGRQVLGDLVYLVPVALAAFLSVLVARRASGRRGRLWRLLAASNVLWLAGDLVWAAYAYLLHREAPFPSVADALYLSSYLLVPPAVLVGFGGASGRRRVRGVLDAAVVALAVGVVGWQLLVVPQLSSGLSWATATGIAYPALGVVIVIVLLTVGPGGHRHVAPSVWLAGLAFLVSAVTDAGYTYLAALHEYLPGAWLNVGWQAEAVLLCLAALCALRHEEGDAQVAPLARDTASAPVLVAAAVALALAAVDAAGHGSSWLYLTGAGVSVLALAVRSVLSVGDTREVALKLDAARREQERLAVTDGLTGLYNRRFFEEMLRIEAERAQVNSSGLALLVADLDHFKQVNDQHGHQSGDAVLAEAAARLKRSLREVDVLARYGGEEFVAILPGADSKTALELAERCRRALSGQDIRLYSGERIRVTASLGVACLPGDTSDVNDLIRLADRALYAAKDSGRDRVLLATGQVSPEPSTGGQPDADAPGRLMALEHLADLMDARLGIAGNGAAMARWVGVLSDALGLDATARQRAVLGARLHDVGRMAVPDALLAGSGPLEIGTPSAQLSVETRLVNICDAWAAMRVDRPDASALTVAEARTRLQAGSGTRHDPELVDLFLSLQAAGLVGQLHDARHRPVPPAAGATATAPQPAG